MNHKLGLLSIPIDIQKYILSFLYPCESLEETKYQRQSLAINKQFYNLVKRIININNLPTLNTIYKNKLYIKNYENEIPNFIIGKELKTRKYELSLIVHPDISYLETIESFKEDYHNKQQFESIIWVEPFLRIELPYSHDSNIFIQRLFYRRDGNWSLFDIYLKIIEFYNEPLDNDTVVTEFELKYLHYKEKQYLKLANAYKKESIHHDYKKRIDKIADDYQISWFAIEIIKYKDSNFIKPIYSIYNHK